MKMYRPHRLCPRNSKPKEPSLYRSLCVSILCMFLSTVMLVGTTFAWFHSSAISAVSTITAGLNATASFVTQEMVNSADGKSLSWIPFDSYSVNPFGSIPLSSNNAKVVFLKLENNSDSDIVYRFALNLLDDTSTNYSLSKVLYFGFEGIGSPSETDTEKGFLYSAHIPGMSTGADGTLTFTFPATGSDGSPVDSVDCLYEHRCTEVLQDSADNISTVTYGGKVHDVTVSPNSTIYVALSLYIPSASNFTITNDYISIQLAMAVGQSALSDQLQPNVVKYYTPPTVRNPEENNAKEPALTLAPDEAEQQQGEQQQGDQQQGDQQQGEQQQGEQQQGEQQQGDQQQGDQQQGNQPQGNQQQGNQQQGDQQQHESENQSDLPLPLENLS